MIGKKRLLFITGTRADYGKIKALIKSVDSSEKFEAFIYVSGMHLLEKYGGTYKEILKDKYKNIFVDFSQISSQTMSYDFGNIVCSLTGYVKNIKPQLIVVHGDRIDALAGAAVGALNNIKVAHIEGGELSGTIDDSIRHAVSKFAHIHLVANKDAKNRLLQLGEEENRIYVIGSPDIDIMMSQLPTLEEAKERYTIPFDDYAIFMYHPVTTEYNIIGAHIKNVVDALIKSQRNYIVIYPNNDLGSETIINELNRLKNNVNYCIFPSVRFEFFLTLLKHASFMIGNSSAGVRETSIYGIPSIDIGSRQSSRYKIDNNTNIQHVDEDVQQILKAINKIELFRKQSKTFGEGNSVELFMELISCNDFWDIPIQKKFIDYDY